jgi:hypothetical protein
MQGLLEYFDAGCESEHTFLFHRGANILKNNSYSRKPTSLENNIKEE